MEWNKQSVKGLLLVVCTGVAFYCVLQHLSAAAAAFQWLLGVTAPLLLGSSLAFILNVPMRAIERHLTFRGKYIKRLRRPLALVLTLIAVVLVLVLAVAVIKPGIEDALSTIIAQVPDAIARLETWATDLQSYLPYFLEAAVDLEVDWQGLSEKVIDFLQGWGKRLLSTGGGLIGSIVSVVTTFIISLIFSFYILLQKEKLSRQGRQVFYALLPESKADRTLYILRLSSRTFSSFLSGQCLEAMILGSLFIVTMTISRLPYALLVGVLIALTALIPIVGAFIGCGVGAVLIAIADPWKALVFIILFLILQQVEGNLIYPNVVGSSVGLPSIWVLAAVTLGGNLMGVVGMLIFIPLCSVLYALFRDFVKERLHKKKIPAHKWRDAPPDLGKK